MFTINQHKDGLSFRVWVQPKSSRNQIVGVHEDALKIKLTAPPVGGAANKMCLKFLAKQLKTPVSDLTLLSGQTSRRKQILIKTAAGQPEARKRLQKQLESLVQKT